MSSRSKASGQAGYSLLELLVVLAILAMIFLIAGPRVIALFEGSKSKAAKIQIANISTALEIYRLSQGSYPTPEQGLAALVNAPPGIANWEGPYLTRQTGVVDPWGRAYLYRTPGQKGAFDVWTLGADGKEGGSAENADVGSWE